MSCKRGEGCGDRLAISLLTNVPIGGYHPSTIRRELARNKSQRGYRHGKAQKKVDRRANEKAAARRKLAPEIWQDAKEKLEEGWTFEQISERAKRDGKPTVSKETFYKEYYRRQRLAIRGASAEELPPLPRRRKLRKTRDRNAKKYRNAGRGKIKGFQLGLPQYVILNPLGRD